MQIFGPANVHGPQPVNAPHSTRTNSAPSPAAESASDQLQISEAAQLASQLAEIPAIRQDRVNDLRAAIADGTYETDEKLDAALERLLDEIG